MTRIRWTGGAYEDLVAKLMDRALVLREQLFGQDRLDWSGQGDQGIVEKSE